MWRRVIYLCSAAGAVIGALYGYGFGQQISGPGLGVLVGLNAGVFGALLVGMVLERLFRSIAPQDQRSTADPD